MAAIGLDDHQVADIESRDTGLEVVDLPGGAEADADRLRAVSLGRRTWMEGWFHVRHSVRRSSMPVSARLRLAFCRKARIVPYVISRLRRLRDPSPAGKRAATSVFCSGASGPSTSRRSASRYHDAITPSTGSRFLSSPLSSCANAATS